MKCAKAREPDEPTSSDCSSCRPANVRDVRAAIIVAGHRRITGPCYLGRADVLAPRAAFWPFIALAFVSIDALIPRSQVSAGHARHDS